MSRLATMIRAASLLALIAPAAAAQEAPLRPRHLLTTAESLRPFPLQLGPAGTAREYADRVRNTAGQLAWHSDIAAASRQAAVALAASYTDAAARAGDGLRARPGSFLALRGQLASPAPHATVLAAFGPRARSGSTTIARHTGITFAPTPDAPASAVADGVCVYAGQIDGLGMVVLLQHQDGYLSVYANLARLLVSEGETVTAAQPLGHTGAASSFGEDGLYFELRELGVPIDPTPWLLR